MKPVRAYVVAYEGQCLDVACNIYPTKVGAEEVRQTKHFPENWTVIPVLISEAPKKRK